MPYVNCYIDKPFSQLYHPQQLHVHIGASQMFCVFFYLLSTFVGSAWSFIPATAANDLRLRRIFYPRFYPFHLFSCLCFWERASIFPFECSILNKGTTDTIFITSLVWRGPWLGNEHGTSRTRSQHYTTRLSRRLTLCIKTRDHTLLFIVL